MRQETIVRELYTFEELNEKAKEKARDWYRSCLDSNDYDYVIEDAKTMAALMGISIDDIYWSGFSHQGSGAQFVGSYSYKKGSLKALKENAPLDERLHAIAKGLAEVQRANGYKLKAKVTSSGRGSASYNTDIEAWKGGEGYDWASDDDANTLKDLLRDFMNWIYRQLEKEDEYINSNESIDENITINDYEFTSEGKRA